MIHDIVGTTVQVTVLSEIFSLSTERSKCFTSHNIFVYFAPSTFIDLQEPVFFSRGATIALTRISFKLLALLNRTIVIFL